MTSRERQAAKAPWRFEYGQQYAVVLSALAVCIAFSTMVPLILPTGLLYLAIKRFVDQNNIIQCAGNGGFSNVPGSNDHHQYQLETHAHTNTAMEASSPNNRPRATFPLVFTATRCMVVCGIVYLAAMTGFFSMRGTAAQFAMMVVLFVASSIAAVVWVCRGVDAATAPPAQEGGEGGGGGDGGDGGDVSDSRDRAQRRRAAAGELDALYRDPRVELILMENRLEQTLVDEMGGGGGDMQ